MEMLGTRFASMSVLLTGLLIVCNPVSLFAGSFPDTTKAHFGKNGGCSEHMDDPTPIGNSPQTFTLCALQSGATEWSADIKKVAAPYTSVCSKPRGPVTGGQGNFTCNITATGSFKGQVNWWVGSSSMMSGVPDQKFTR